MTQKNYRRRVSRQGAEVISKNLFKKLENKIQLLAKNI